MRGKVAAITACITGLTLAILTALYPANTDFWFQNPFWNGMSNLGKLGAREVSLADAYSLNTSEYALLVLGPSKPFTRDDARAVRTFLDMGGTVVVADDFGTANQLLELLGVPARLSGRLLVDPLFNLGDPRLPQARWRDGWLALNYATTLNLSACKGCTVIAESTEFSYLDLNLNGRHDESEPTGPFPVAASIRVGAGTLILVADSSLFINSMLDKGLNKDFLSAALGSKKPAVDTEHWEEGPLIEAKKALSTLWSAVSSPEVKYSLIALALVSSYTLGKRLPSGQKIFTGGYRGRGASV